MTLTAASLPPSSADLPAPQPPPDRVREALEISKRYVEAYLETEKSEAGQSYGKADLRRITDALSAPPREEEKATATTAGERVASAKAQDGVLAPAAPSPPKDAGAVLESMQREHVAAVVHRGRYPEDRTPEPFNEEDRSGREYCFRIADGLLAAFPQLSAPPQPAADRVRADAAARALFVWDNSESRAARDWDCPHPEMDKAPYRSKARAVLRALSTLEAAG